MSEQTYVRTVQLAGGIIEGVGAAWYAGDRETVIEQHLTDPAVVEWTTEQRDGAEYYVVTYDDGGVFRYRFDVTPAAV